MAVLLAGRNVGGAGVPGTVPAGRVGNLDCKEWLQLMPQRDRLEVNLLEIVVTMSYSPLLESGARDRLVLRQVALFEELHQMFLQQAWGDGSTRTEVTASYLVKVVRGAGGG